MSQFKQILALIMLTQYTLIHSSAAISLQNDRKRTREESYCSAQEAAHQLKRQRTNDSTISPIIIDQNLTNLFAQNLTQAFNLAIDNSDRAFLEKNINQCSTADLMTDNAANILHHAAKKGNLDAVKIIMRAHAALLFDQNRQRELPIHCALNRSHVEIVRYMLETNESLTKMPDRFGYELAFTAIHKKQTISMIGAIIAFTAGTDRNPLRDCAKLHNRSDVMILLDAEIACRAAALGNLRTLALLPAAQTLDCFGLAPVHYAAANGQLRIVQFLHNRSSFSSWKIDSKGRIPLYHAIKSGCTDIIEYYLRMLEGQRLSKWRDYEQKSVLHYSVLFDNYSVYNSLKHNTARKYPGYRTPMHIAIAREQIFFVILISNECPGSLSVVENPNDRTKAVLSSNTAIREWFRSLKASEEECSAIRARLFYNFFSFQPFLALEASAPEIFSELIKIFADSIIQANNSNPTALSVAILNGHLGAVKIIVAHNPECLDARYDRPFFNRLDPAQLAALFEKKDIQEYLIDHLMARNGLPPTFVNERYAGQRYGDNETVWDL